MAGLTADSLASHSGRHLQERLAALSLRDVVSSSLHAATVERLAAEMKEELHQVVLGRATPPEEETSAPGVTGAAMVQVAPMLFVQGLTRSSRRGAKMGPCSQAIPLPGPHARYPHLHSS